jgi:hypothetical protein
MAVETKLKKQDVSEHLKHNKTKIELDGKKIDLIERDAFCEETGCLKNEFSY